MTYLDKQSMNPSQPTQTIQVRSAIRTISGNVGRSIGDEEEDSAKKGEGSIELLGQVDC